MKRPILSLLVPAIIFTTSGTAILRALHSANAGPENVQIKFKLPPPAPLTAEEEAKTFKVAPGFKVELVATDPMVNTPVALSWDEKGRMFVCEMSSYMEDVDGKGEDQPRSRIAMLEDTDGDGKMDKRTIFADNLYLARAVTCVNGGALVAEPPSLWFMTDTDGDGKADVKELVDGAYGTRTGQPEHMANSTTRFLDNWVYSANHGARYRLKDGKWISDAVPSRGQWGMAQDDFGRQYYNFNSDFLRANFVPEALYKRNPNSPGSAGAGVRVAADQSIWPSHPTPGVNRGYEPKQLREDGTLTACTATCGAAIYRGTLLPGCAGNAFIPEPAGNLVKRFILDEKDGVLTARNAYDKTEFLTSTDERFRPVYAYNAPDGALYIVDMYRGIIQHKGFLTHYLIANIKDRKLEQPISQGRIWRIVPDKGTVAKPAPMPTDPTKLAELLNSPNGWTRDTAQRLLVEKKDAASAAPIAAVVKNGTPLGKVHALWTLEGIAAATPDVVGAALKDKDAKVRATAVRIADRTLVPELAKLVNDPSVDVQIALGFTLSTFPEGQAATVALAQKAGANAMVRDAILSGLRGRELEILEALGTDKSPEFASALASAVMNERRSARVKKLLTLIAAQPANSPAQLAMLDGASGKNDAKGAPKYKLLYLESEAADLAKLAAGADAKAKPLLAALDSRVAWAGKPGVPPPPVVKPLSPDEQKLYAVGQQVYSTLCTACHQPNGQGMDGLAPSLVDSEWVLGDADRLPKIVMNGLTGPIKVNGLSWALEMPPLGAALTDEQIAGVTTYIRREWEHTASPVSLDLVAKIRAESKSRTTAWTAEELGMVAKPKAKK